MSYMTRGARKEDLVAGLAFSIAYNYLNRLVRDRKIGDCIYFQGGTAYNDAVAAAFSQILGKEIIVPPYNGVMGALGMALAGPGAHAAHRVPDQVPRLGPAGGGLHRRRLRLQGLQQRVRRAPVHHRRREDLLGRQVLGQVPQARQGGQAAGHRRPGRRARAGSAGRSRRAPSGACRKARPPSACRAPCTPSTGCPSGRRSSPPSGTVPSSRRRATAASARPGWTPRSPSRASPSGWRTATWRGWRSTASSASSSPTRSTRRRSSRATTRTPARGGRRCPSSCARRRGWSSTTSSS